MRVGGDRWVGWDWGPIGPGDGMVAIGGNVITKLTTLFSK